MNNEQTQSLWDEAKKLLSNHEETSAGVALAYLNYLVPLSVDEKNVIFTTHLLFAKQWVEDHYLSIIGDVYLALLGSKREIIIVLDDNTDVVVANTPSNSSSANDSQSNSAQNVQHPSITVVSSQTQSQTQIQAQLQQPGQLQQQAQAQVVTQLGNTQVFPAIQQQTSETGVPNLNLPVNINQPITEISGAKSIGAMFTPDLPVTSNPEPNQNQKSFDNFVVGDSNDYAYSTAVRVSEFPGQYINPLFIYGRSGLGKTHLQLAIKNALNLYHPEKRVVYAPTVEFVNDFTNAIANNDNLTSFKRKYHTCDVLLLDDVQSLENKDATINALFEIFNMFIDQRKQIVLSADRSPVEINLDERFTSRFASGVTAGIQPPSYEMKTAIFMNYKTIVCNQFNVSDVVIPDDVIQYIIESSGSNIRELEGAVTNIVGTIAFKPEKKGNTFTIEEAAKIVDNFFTQNTTKININVIQQAIESYYNVSHNDLLSDKRSKNISHPRQVAMFLSRQLTPNSYPDIGKSFGGKDHTTVMYAYKNIQKKLVESVGIRAEVERIKEIISS